MTLEGLGKQAQHRLETAKSELGQAEEGEWPSQSDYSLWCEEAETELTRLQDELHNTTHAVEEAASRQLATLSEASSTLEALSNSLAGLGRDSNSDLQGKSGNVGSEDTEEQEKAQEGAAASQSLIAAAGRVAVTALKQLETHTADPQHVFKDLHADAIEAQVLAQLLVLCRSFSSVVT